jgi:hypothetical protein
MAEKVPNSFEVCSLHKILNYLQIKTGQSSAVFNFFAANVLVKQPGRKDNMFGRFFCPGNIFRLIWPKSFAKSWQHW